MKTLITTDGSAEANDAIDRYCRMLPRAVHEHLVLTVNEYESYGIIDSVDDAEMNRLQEENSQRILGSAREVLAKHGVVATAIHRNGQAADAILTCAEKENVDLIVLGARGAGAVTRILLGSTSDAVVSYSESSVWVVRPQSGKSDPISLHVTVGYDGSEASKRAIEFVRSLELPSECEISLLALVRRPENLPDEIQYDHPHSQAMAKEMEELKKQFPEEGARVRCVVGETAHVGHGIVDFAERNHSALVVVGDKGRSAIARFFLGSISRYVLHHAMCSVLVVKDPTSERLG